MQKIPSEQKGLQGQATMDLVRKAMRKVTFLVLVQHRLPLQSSCCQTKGNNIGYSASCMHIALPNKHQTSLTNKDSMEIVWS